MSGVVAPVSNPNATLCNPTKDINSSKRGVPDTRCWRVKTRPIETMEKTPPLFSTLPLVLLLLLTIVRSQELAPQCKRITGYEVCERKGTLVDVTQQEFEDRLDIHDMNLLSIRENAFKNLSTTKLSLGLGNKISVVRRESFKGLDKLARLDLDSNAIQLSPNLFSELKQLNSLSLIFNRIDDIPRDTFADLSNLMWLYLGHNDVRSIDKNSFSGLSSSLLFLWLNDNKISSIEWHVWPDARVDPPSSGEQ